MTYIRKHARFTILDDMPADVWQEPEGFLCIVGEEPADYHGDFSACTFTPALYRGEHVPVSADYLRKSCTLADEATARKILAFYLREWARIEDPDAAELLREEADALANA